MVGVDRCPVVIGDLVVPDDPVGGTRRCPQHTSLKRIGISPDHQTLDDHPLSTTLKSELCYVLPIENGTGLTHKTLVVLGANRLLSVDTGFDDKHRPSRIGIHRRLNRLARRNKNRIGGQDRSWGASPRVVGVVEEGGVVVNIDVEADSACDAEETWPELVEEAATPESVLTSREHEPIVS